MAVDSYRAAGSPQTASGFQSLVCTEAVPVPTYCACITGLVPASSATDVFTITGSAAATIRVKKILIGGRATAAANMDVQLIKRSAADTAGTSTAPTAVPNDSNSVAATAVLAAYTANPTTGTAIGTMQSVQVPLGNLTTGTASGVQLEFGVANTQSIVLRGAAQQLAINLNGVTYSGGLLDITVIWTEDNS